MTGKKFWESTSEHTENPKINEWEDWVIFAVITEYGNSIRSEKEKEIKALKKEVSDLNGIINSQ